LEVAVLSKVCRVCQKEKSLDLFPKNENRCKACRAEYDKVYARQNPEKRAASQKRYNSKNKVKANKRYNVKRATDPLFRLRGNLSSLIRKVLQAKGYSKTSKTFELLGADIVTVQDHLIKTAINTYGFHDFSLSYHLDHIVPVSLAKTEAELIELQHYTNLQYLYPKDNLSKSDKLDWTLTPAI